MAPLPTSRAARSRARHGVLLLTAAATAAVLAGCAAPTTTTDTAAPATVAIPPPTGAATPGTNAGPGGTAPSGAAYTSQITSDVVANPAFDALGADITRRVGQAGLPGASLLVLHDGRLVEQEAFGSYTLDTVVPIASASKWLSGATIMTLVDDGLIALDEPIRTYLPEATGPSGRITMRQLLSFTSGLEYDERIGCYQDLTKTLAECNREILTLPLLGPPGSGYRYTGTHLHVAAGVAEAVTGQTFEQLFQERIAGPLGMTKTTLVPPTHVGRSADGHPQPAGSGISTLGDYGRFLEMLVHDGVAPDGTRVLTESSLAAMSTDQTGDAKFISASPNRKAADTPYGLAHWLDVTNPDGTAVVESSPGAFGFRPWIDHANDVAGVYLVVDMDDSHVIDSPDHEAGANAVQTSGNFVVAGTAKALGGQVPEPSPRSTRR